MGIVGTVDSAYKAIGAEDRQIDGVAMPGVGHIALGLGMAEVFDGVGPSAGARRRAWCKRVLKNASMQRRRRCGAMGEERHEAQARAAQCASGCGGGSIEAREERLNAKRFGFLHGRLAERGARPIEPRA